MPIDPAMQAVVDRFASPPKALFAAGGDPFAVAKQLRSAPPSPSPAADPDLLIEDRMVAGVPCRLYRPSQQSGLLPVLLNIHGGCWIFGDLDSDDARCRRVAKGVGCLVVNIDYRLAPEHIFPAALDDAWAVLQAVVANPADFGADVSRIAVSGGSAGGNIAAGVALRAKEAGGPKLVFQWLIYPICDSGCATPSYAEFADGPLLTEAMMRWSWDQYVPDPADRAHPHVSMAHATDPAGLPPALVAVAEYDPLRDEGEAYAQAMAAAGVPVTLRRHAGMCHGFVALSDTIPEGQRALAEGITALKAAFA